MFLLSYPLFLVAVGYSLVIIHLDLGVYSNIVSLGCASIVCERWFALTNKRTYVISEVIKISIFAWLYDFTIQVTAVAIFFGPRKAFVDNLLPAITISIGHLIILFLGFMLLSSIFAVKQK